MLALLVLLLAEMASPHVIWMNPSARQNIGILRPQCNLPKVSAFYDTVKVGAKVLIYI